MKSHEKPVRILFIDDEEDVLFAYERIIQNPEIIIETAICLPEAMAFLAKHDYKAVVTDMRLADTESKEGLEIIKASKTRNPRCKVIVVSAFGYKTIKDSAFELGADLFLEKPVSPAKIRDVLSSMGIG
jgi:two-component system response regulator HydG